MIVTKFQMINFIRSNLRRQRVHQSPSDISFDIPILIPEQFNTAIGPPSFIWRGGGGGEGGGGGAKKVRNTFIPVYIHIHIQNHTKQTKSPIFWTARIGHMAKIRTNPGKNTNHKIWLKVWHFWAQKQGKTKKNGKFHSFFEVTFFWCNTTVCRSTRW